MQFNNSFQRTGSVGAFVNIIDMCCFIAFFKAFLALPAAEFRRTLANILTRFLYKTSSLIVRKGGKMNAIKKTGKFAFALVILIVMCACSPVVYKKEVSVFSQGVENVTSAFEKLRQESIEMDQQDLDDLFAKSLTDIDVSDECSDLVSKLQKQANCFGKWAKYLAGEGEKPTMCEEPIGFFELPIDFAQKCQIGPIDAEGRIDPSKFEAEPVLRQTAVMSNKLSEYASALSEIADSKDIEELQSALGEAKAAITEVADHYKDLTDKEVPNAQAIGPISELLSTVAVTTLEWRRFNAMKEIVNKADPTVTAAGKRLSINTMPVVFKTRIRPAQVNLVEAAEEFNPEILTTGNYPSKLKSIREAYTIYIQQLENDPSSAFKAMVNAHTALKDALNDPKTRYENMQAKIKIFYEKAKAVHDALDKSSN
jgi:transcription initiation factor IIF auxiliary subunit